MKNFSNYFTFDDFMVIANAQLQNQINKEQTKIDNNTLNHENLYIPIHKFLSDYKKENGLSPLDNSTWKFSRAHNLVIISTLKKKIKNLN